MSVPKDGLVEMIAAAPVRPLVPWSGGTASMVVDQAAAVDRLPGGAEQDPYERLATAFLLGYARNTAKGYAGDLRMWWSWCLSCGVHPFDARRHHVDAWVRSMELPVIENGGAPLKPSSIRRRLSAVSKLYKYGISAEVLTYSPVDHVARPKASEETDSIGLSAAEVRAMLDVASERSLLHAGLLTLLAYNGLRIEEALGANVGDYTHSSGHRVLRITRKGDKRATVPIAPPTARALDDYLASRTVSVGHPLFANYSGMALTPFGGHRVMRLEGLPQGGCSVAFRTGRG